MGTKTDKSVMLQRFQETICSRKGLISCGDGFTVALHHSGRLLYAGTNRRGQASAASPADIVAVCAAGDSAVALRGGGTVYTVGRSDSETAFVHGLAGVRRLEATPDYIAVLLADKQLLVGGDAPHAVYETAGWSSVTDIACGHDFIAGLSADGCVLLAGGSRAMRRTVGAWRDVAGIFADRLGKALYAITAEGRLLATCRLPLRTRNWSNLVFVSAVGRRLCAVTASGQLLSTFPHPSDTSDKDFVACATGASHAVALTRDGEVVSWGDNRFGQCQTAVFGRLFAQFEELSVQRRASILGMAEAERRYRSRCDEAARFAGRLACGRRLTACVTANGHTLTTLGVTSGNAWSNVCRIACGNAHILALTEDGRVLADGNAIGEGNRDCCRVGEWQNVSSLAVGRYHSLGVTTDGHVYFCGDNQNGQGDVEDWENIRLVRTTDAYTVGLTHDGQLCIAGLPPFDPHLLEVFNGHVTDVAVTDTHILCRLSDGRAVATTPPDPATGRAEMNPEVSAWYHVASVAAGHGVSVGLCFGGAVRISGGDATMQREVASWENIVSVGCGEGYVVGLDADGHLHVAGKPALARRCHTDPTRAHTVSPAPVQTPFSESAHWQDVIAFACGPTHMIALDGDGQVLACGSDSDGQCSLTTHFTLFRDAHSSEAFDRARGAGEQASVE